MNIKELEKIALKDDVDNAGNFRRLAKQVVNVPKDELDRRERAYQKEREKKKKG